MNIDHINRRHFTKTDMYYRVSYGVSSKLISYKQGIFEIEVVIGSKWKKEYNATAYEMASCWRNKNQELSKSVGCKVYIIDARAYPFKKQLMGMGVQPLYDAKKGIIFRKKILN